MCVISWNHSPKILCNTFIMITLHIAFIKAYSFSPYWWLFAFFIFIIYKIPHPYSAANHSSAALHCTGHWQPITVQVTIWPRFAKSYGDAPLFYNFSPKSKLVCTGQFSRWLLLQFVLNITTTLLSWHTINFNPMILEWWSPEYAWRCFMRSWDAVCPCAKCRMFSPLTNNYLIVNTWPLMAAVILILN